jgi:hypothetical protein
LVDVPKPQARCVAGFLAAVFLAGVFFLEADFLADFFFVVATSWVRLVSDATDLAAAGAPNAAALA